MPNWIPPFDEFGKMKPRIILRPAAGRLIADPRNLPYDQLIKPWRYLVAGDTTVDMLDDEEIARGRVRGGDGRFADNSKAPPWVPKTIHEAFRRELLRRGAKFWSRWYFVAVDTLGRVMADSAMDPKDRIRAAVEIINRVEGKPMERRQVQLMANQDEQIEAVGKAISGMLAALGHDINDEHVREVAFKALNDVSDAAAPKETIEGELG